jgi:hypothetical protein
MVDDEDWDEGAYVAYDWRFLSVLSIQAIFYSCYVWLSNFHTSGATTGTYMDGKAGRVDSLLAKDNTYSFVYIFGCDRMVFVYVEVRVTRGEVCALLRSNFPDSNSVLRAFEQREHQIHHHPRFALDTHTNTQCKPH